ncbi:hypothetical protein RHECNPAF_696001 [Rhizobium etli CNPAF512]|nr:hypothetical protein RHECNPAF_696001 [Rhizobium etli CNPAF512]
MRLESGGNGAQRTLRHPFAQIVDRVGADTEFDEMQCHTAVEILLAASVKRRRHAARNCAAVLRLPENVEPF